ncbi:hypothetical protein [Azospirillum doebereinerae]
MIVEVSGYSDKKYPRPETTGKQARILGSENAVGNSKALPCSRSYRPKGHTRNTHIEKRKPMKDLKDTGSFIVPGTWSN